jgi:hypothetical protein
LRGTDTEYYFVFCEGLAEGNIERNWYWILLCLLWGCAEGNIEWNWYWMLLCCEGLTEGNIERNWYWILLYLLWGSGGGQYREELILNVTVFVVRVWWRAM